MRGLTAREIGAAVRAARRRQQLTQAELGEAAGVTRLWVARFERGHAASRMDIVLRVLDVLGLELHLTEDHIADGQMTHDDERSASAIDLDALIDEHRR